jgi:hypothetical protein
MQLNIRWLVVLALLAWTPAAPAATNKVIKVLPHLLDKEGRQSLSPSLYDRDAYQAQLRKSPGECSGLRFDVHWKAPKGANLRLKAELRGMKGDRPQTRVMETALAKPSASGRWTKLTLTGGDYQQFGRLSAWRVTLWDGETLLGEQSSFLWANVEAQPDKK